jgi:putative SOS response-associated peptidase YedK
MCGRAKVTADPEDLAEAFGLDEIPPMRARWNLAPTEPIPVIRTPGRLELFTWGERRKGRPWFLVRSENSLAGWKRCLVVVDGFYEWRKDKQPFLFQRPDGRPFALGGVWKADISEDGEVTEHAFVITVPASAAVMEIHDRMPLVLSPDDYDDWMRGVGVRSYEGLEVFAVSKRVNNVRNDDAGCVERAP